MSERVAFVGDADLVTPLRVLGIRVYSPKSLNETRRILARLEEEGIALCFIHESFYENLREETEVFQKKFYPVVVGFSDYRQASDYLAERMKEMAVQATGSDSLVKRRG